MSFTQLPLFSATKTCGICALAKPLDSFHRDKSRKDGLCFRCKACVRAYYDQTRDVQMATARAWQRAHPEACTAATDRWRKTHPEAARAIRTASSARWVKNNPERVRAMAKAYRDAHKDDPVYRERERERLRRNWYAVYRFRPRKRNPITRKAAYHRYRSRLKNAEGSFTGQEWLACMEAHGNRCAICHEEKKLCADHIIPISKGGSNYITNIQPLCFSCNSRKKDKMPGEWTP